MILTKEQKSAIDAKARGVLDSISDGGQTSLPINLFKIADSCGLTVKIGEFADPSISGIYDRSLKTIFVSKNEQLPRQLFTIAHELGHYILHDEKPSEIFYRLDSLHLDKQDNQEETEANWFAASLLMPHDSVKRLWTATKDIEKLSAVFSVSYTAMWWRLKNLELLQ